MRINRVHKIRLIPNNKQVGYFQKACGISRFAYNWGLDNWKKQYEAGDKPSSFTLKKQFNAIKKEEYPWISEVTKCSPEQAFANLDRAFKNFFRNVKAGKKPGYPKFHKKGFNDSFYISNDSFQVKDRKIRIPKLGWVRMREELRFDGKILSATVSRKADKWYVSINVELEIPEPVHENQGTVVGVDLGISKLAALSNGEVFLGPKPHKQLLLRLRLLNKALSRKKKGSRNRTKAKVRLSKCHLRIANIRNDSLHKLSHYLTSEFHIIGIEDLAVSNMVRNKRLAKSILDMGWGELRKQVEYKSETSGSIIAVADRFFASTKMCCRCGKLHDMPLGKRFMDCECGNKMDRDLNSGINLENMAVGIAVTACGDDARPYVGQMSEKQEFNSMGNYA